MTLLSHLPASSNSLCFWTPAIQYAACQLKHPPNSWCCCICASLYQGLFSPTSTRPRPPDCYCLHMQLVWLAPQPRPNTGATLACSWPRHGEDACCSRQTVQDCGSRSDLPGQIIQIQCLNTPVEGGRDSPSKPLPRPPRQWLSNLMAYALSAMCFSYRPTTPATAARGNPWQPEPR